MLFIAPIARHKTRRNTRSALDPVDIAINAVKAAGFNTVRIPVAWDSHANRTTHVIDAAWLARVKQVVDYCYANGMYVIIDNHWDNGWFDGCGFRRFSSTVNTKMQSYWTQ